ncbi:MAG: hypothetical protein ABH803_01155 [Candidatus Micrarchaeota archaeon]
MANKAVDAFFKEIPNVLIIVVLLLVLLVVLTKFNWVHCSQVPGNWCKIYCDYVEQSHGKIALVYGDNGLGDEQAFYQMMRSFRPNTYVERFHLNHTTSGLLNGFNAVVLMHAKEISSRQVQMIKDYVNRGGVLIVVGDSASSHYVDDFDLITARQKNASFFEQLLIENITDGTPEYTDAIRQAKQTSWYRLLYNQSYVSGFDALEDVFSAKFVSVKNSPGIIEMRGVLRDNYVWNGLSANISFQTPAFALITPDSARVTEIALIKLNDNEFYPAIFESRYVGKIIYFAVPLEDIGSPALVNNLFDYLVVC